MKLGLVGLAAAFTLAAHVGVAATPQPYERFCQSRALSFSPQGRYVYAMTYTGMVYAETDCLVSGRNDCPLTRANNPDAFTRGAYFSASDDEIYLKSGGLGSDRWVNGDTTLRAFSTRETSLGDPRPFFQLKSDLLGHIDVERRAGPFDDVSQALADPTNRLLNEAERRRSTLGGGRLGAINVRNMYGRVVDGRSVYLFRSDDDYSVGYRLDGGPERPLWVNGNPFSERRSNINFKFDGSDAIGLVSGSVIRISPTRALKDETATKSRAVLIDGDDSSVYYGYWSAEGLNAKGVNPELVRRIEQTLRDHASDHVSGLAVSNRTGSTVLSYGPFRAVNGQALTRHDIARGDQRVQIDCGGERLARHEVRRVGGSEGLFVDRYIAGPERTTVLYLTGGPGGHVNLESGFDNDVATLLSNGFNVDVIQYGGSNYTFAQYNRLSAKGPASILHDTRLIEEYVAKTYDKEADIAVYGFSFGAYFYRHFSDEFLERLSGVVLASPAGTMTLPDYSEVSDAQLREPIGRLSANLNALLWGRDTLQGEASYFAALKRCPLRFPVTIVVGDKDTAVSPLRDYAICRDARQVRFLTHAYGHISPLDPLYVTKVEVAPRILRILEGNAEAK